MEVMYNRGGTLKLIVLVRNLVCEYYCITYTHILFTIELLYLVAQKQELLYLKVLIERNKQNIR